MFVLWDKPEAVDLRAYIPHLLIPLDHRPDTSSKLGFVADMFKGILFSRSVAPAPNTQRSARIPPHDIVHEFS